MQAEGSTEHLPGLVPAEHVTCKKVECILHYYNGAYAVGLMKFEGNWNSMAIAREHVEPFGIRPDQAFMLRVEYDEKGPCKVSSRVVNADDT